jgi:VWFA-related protein
MIGGLKKLAMTVLLGILLVSLSGFAPAQAPTPQASDLLVRITQVDTSKFPAVTVYVSVTNAAGEPVEVSASRFVLRENGVVMKAEDVQATGDIGPLTTMLVMDVSGSMSHAGKLEAARAAARAYVDQSRPKDLIGLLAFNTNLDYLQPLTSNHEAVVKAIDGLKPKGDTAMYDALARAIDLMEAVSGRKAVIVMTDGLDNRSKISPQEVIRMIGPEGLSISVIGLGEPEQSTSALASLDEGALSALAEEAGGVYGYANDADSLRALYERYGRALHSEYAIQYTSLSKLRDGVNRSLSVTLEGTGGASTSAEIKESYNPGGLVPEVAKPASWGLFLALIVGVLVLLIVPKLVSLVFSPVRERLKSGVKTVKKEPRVKLKS